MDVLIEIGFYFRHEFEFTCTLAVWDWEKVNEHFKWTKIGLFFFAPNQAAKVKFTVPCLDLSYATANQSVQYSFY